MKHRFFALCVLFIAGLTHAQCQFETVTFHSNFDGARLDACSQLTASHYLLTTKPENTPINPSPWYAFAITSKQPQSVTLSIAAENAKPRYLPKISTDGENWSLLPFEIDDNGFVVNIDVSSEKIIISGQELIVAEDYDQWMDDIAQSSPFKRINIGKSTEKNDIDALVHTEPDNDEWLVILGRQHPPEITGALALFHFVDVLAEQYTKSPAFYERFNILIVPMVNPDGVANGNWRHNTGGVDLNRDWGKFTQQETRVVHQAMQNMMADNHRLVFALDFHSTQQDVFYTMPNDYGLAAEGIVLKWLDDIKKARVSSFTMRDRPGSSPGRGVFKQFVADYYGVHSVTYEMGDNTARPMVAHIAKVSAETLVQRMLATAKTAFIVQPKDDS